MYAGGRVLLRSRRGTDMTASFPEIRAAALAQLPENTGLDGELVVCERDRLAFERLQQRLARRGTAHPAPGRPSSGRGPGAAPGRRAGRSTRRASVGRWTRTRRCRRPCRPGADRGAGRPRRSPRSSPVAGSATGT
ncbi:DNA ligase-like domain-containing protein [Streptomyces cellulosae]|uniref:ATP-dependent DNA ligase family profile domain-containing protein n=1 Tax=Streptomyces cellulosae TaxID=1968 RepID=A0ABW7YC63_STRCE